MSKIKFCRVCSSDRLTYIWDDRDNLKWYHCAACDSESSETVYRHELYGPQYATLMLSEIGGMDNAKGAVNTNIDWFDKFKLSSGRDFLDIGFAEGASTIRMKELGWTTYGFDIQKMMDYENTLEYPYFAAHLFPLQFDAILCREVIEHVDGWHWFLSELATATKRGGLLQLQTPRPSPDKPGHVYQAGHLQVFSPKALEREALSHGFGVLDRLLWDSGQALMLEMRDKP